MYKGDRNHPKQRAEELKEHLTKYAKRYQFGRLAEKLEQIRPALEEQNLKRPPEERLDTSWIDTFCKWYSEQSKPKAI